MENKHTSGPWLIADTDKRFVYALAQKGVIGRLREPNMVNAFSCLVQNDNNLLSREEQEANAKLIAAAPELLEQLKTANKWIKLLVEMIPQESDYAQAMRAGIERMEEAIKKATE